jgi:hypothetical protein
LFIPTTSLISDLGEEDVGAALGNAEVGSVHIVVQHGVRHTSTVPGESLNNHSIFYKKLKKLLILIRHFK